jgi:hypothetical protein
MSQSEEISQPSGNWLLDALPREDYERIAPNLKPITFALGDVIYESQGQMEHSGKTAVFLNASRPSFGDSEVSSAAIGLERKAGRSNNRDAVLY